MDWNPLGTHTAQSIFCKWFNIYIYVAVFKSDWPLKVLSATTWPFNQQNTLILVAASEWFAVWFVPTHWWHIIRSHLWFSIFVTGGRGLTCNLLITWHSPYHLSHSNQNTKYIFNKHYVWIMFCEKQLSVQITWFEKCHRYSRSPACSAAEQRRERTSFPNVAYALRR